MKINLKDLKAEYKWIRNELKKIIENQYLIIESKTIDKETIPQILKINEKNIFDIENNLLMKKYNIKTYNNFKKKKEQLLKENIRMKIIQEIPKTTSIVEEEIKKEKFRIEERLKLVKTTIFDIDKGLENLKISSIKKYSYLLLKIITFTYIDKNKVVKEKTDKLNEMKAKLLKKIEKMKKISKNSESINPEMIKLINSNFSDIQLNQNKNVNISSTL